jgi:hypothetical protein
MGAWKGWTQIELTSVTNLDVLYVASDLDGLANNLVTDAAS